MTNLASRFHLIVGVLTLVLGFALSSITADAQVTPFKQALAEAAAKDKDIAAFYKANGFKSVWTGRSGKERQRRAALLQALSKSDVHGLPAASYNVPALKAKMQAAKSAQERGRLEVEMSRVFLDYARDLQTGILIPSRVDSAIVRKIPYRDRTSYLVNFTKSSPTAFMKALAPRTTEYNALMKEKLRMERLLARGGWGPKVNAKSLKPGQSSAAVVAMRNRLIAMGYMKRTNSQSYDDTMRAAVQQFQQAHGLSADGDAGTATIAEINKSVEQRLQSVIVAMERERWVNRERGRRHILVNIPDFTANVIDNGKVTFKTRSVVGANEDDRPTPEFSDVMEYMVINPSWYVPRSIVTKEYLPILRKNPYGVKHI